MTANAPVRRAPVGARRTGYAIAAVLTAGFWYVVNIRPGWQALPFLTDEAAQIVAWLNVSLAVSLIANVLYVAYDPPWWKSFGDLATTAVGLAVLMRLWQVFPFAFAGSFDWALLVRVMVIVAIAGSIIGIVVNVVALFRSIAHLGRPGTAGRQGS
jgi:hypothetical protein